MEHTRKRIRGRPRNTRRRDLLKDTKRTGYNWRELEKSPG